MRYIDSHCHLDFPELSENLDEHLAEMVSNDVQGALCVAVSLQDFPRILRLVENHSNLVASVGVHPGYPDEPTPSVEELIALSENPKVVAIGETGLDYFHCKGDVEWQRERFRFHIRAAIASGKPLIVHTRAAAEDTLSILREENADRVGGVMHCFTEDWSVAKACLDLGFCISFSGIVSFKNAEALREVVRQVPEDRILIETDAPYLAPVPFRGKINRPGLVSHVAVAVADARGVSVSRIAELTSSNFLRTFPAARPYFDVA